MDIHEKEDFPDFEEFKQIFEIKKALIQNFSLRNFMKNKLGVFLKEQLKNVYFLEIYETYMYKSFQMRVSIELMKESWVKIAGFLEKKTINKFPRSLVVDLENYLQSNIITKMFEEEL